MLPRARLVLAALVLVAGCGPVSEASSLELFVDEDGALIWMYAGTSASGVEVDLDWALELENRGSAPCAFAVHELDAPPSSWPLASLEAGAEATGEPVATGQLEPGDSWTIGPTPWIGTESEIVEGWIALEVCPDAALQVGVRVEVRAALGVRAISDALTLQLLRAQ